MCSVELLKFTRSNYEQWQVCVPPSRPQHMHALWPTPTRASHDCATSHAVRLNPSHNVCLCLSALSFFDTRILTHPTPTPTSTLQDHPDEPPKCDDAWSRSGGFHDSRYYDWYAVEPECETL